MPAALKTDNLATPMDFGRRDTSGPLARTVTALHRGFADQVSMALSAFLRREVNVSLDQVTRTDSKSFLNTLASPSCLIVFRLVPRSDLMYLHFDLPVVFGLLELLLGGPANGAPPEERHLTEIEWSLLEEVIRVLVKPLGEAWRSLVQVEFQAESLVGEPALLPPSEAGPLLQISFDVANGEQTGKLEIAVPVTLFESDATAPEEQPASLAALPAESAARVNRLESAFVPFEVRLEGPTVRLNDLATLAPDEVLTFSYPLDRPLRAYLDSDTFLEGQVIGLGRKRAFKITSLPQPAQAGKR